MKKVRKAMKNQLVVGEPYMTYYNASGLITRFESSDDGTVSVYAYDDHGNVISKDTIRSSNGSTTVVKVVYENTYDKLGRLTLSVKYEETTAGGESEQNRAELTPVFQSEYAFDVHGNLILERFTYLTNNVGYENSYAYQSLS